jgi:hypothetical protein
MKQIEAFPKLRFWTDRRCLSGCLEFILTANIKEKRMKKTLMFVFVWLTMMVLGGGGLLFARGVFSINRTAPVVEEEEVPVVVAEVPDNKYLPRRNPNAQRATGSVYALPATPLNPEAERLLPPVYAISGVRGVEILESNPLEAVDIVVMLPAGETFSRIIPEGWGVSDWIPNLPAGLEARAHGIKRGATSIKIYISGTPATTGREEIRVSIPGAYLSSGNPRQFVSPTEQETIDSWQKSQTE